MSKYNIRIGTRKSKLALWQAKTVAEKLKEIGFQSSIISIKSEGDINLTQPLYSFGIQGIFTKALDSSLINQKIDIAVHSLKDVPTSIPSGIILGAVLKRGDPFDTIVYKNTEDYNKKGLIGTGSLRRKAQWLKKYPSDKIESVRGNIQTRIKKLNNSKYKGIIMAKAAIDRLSIKNIQLKKLDWMIPAPAQGAIGIACLKKDKFIRKILSNINCVNTEFCTKLEREFLRILEGGCSAPIGGISRIEKNYVHFHGGVFSLDGKVSELCTDKFIIDENPISIGKIIANKLLEKGGDKIIRSIKNKI